MVEDQNFFNHQGISFKSISRAFFTNVKAGDIEQGGSTITQQLAKQCYPVEFKTRNINTKVIEAFLANRIEKSFTKPRN